MSAKVKTAQESGNFSDLEAILPAIRDYPKPGINFRDIDTFLKAPSAFKTSCELIYNHFLCTPIDAVAGIESRGFLWATKLADMFNVSIIMIRKPGKLPQKVKSIDYEYEYSKGTLCMEDITDTQFKNILIVDDIIATGGSLLAACKLVEECKANVAGVAALLNIVLPDEAVTYQSKKNLFMYDSYYPLIQTTGGVLHEVDVLDKQDEKDEAKTEDVNVDNTKRIILFDSDMEYLADQICKSSSLFTKGNIKWHYFPDSYPDIEFPDNLAGRDVVYIFSLFDKSKFLERLSQFMVLPRQRVNSLEVLLPYFAPGTMERVSKPGVLATADTVASIITRCLPITRSGPTPIAIFDIHNIVTRFCFDDRARYWPLSNIAAALKQMKLLCGHKPWAVVFPDKGSYTRSLEDVRKFDPNIPIITCGKVRDGDKRIIRIADYTGIKDLKDLFRVIIVDDLVQSGCTLFECMKTLNVAGITNVCAYVTHAVFPNRGYTKFMENGKYAGFEHFWISDSIPQHAKILDVVFPFKVLSLVPAYLNDFMICNRIVKKELKVLLASTSNIKKLAVQTALDEIFPDRSVIINTMNFASDVPEQPYDEETKNGSINRINNAIDYDTEHKYDLYVSIENGIKHVKCCDCKNNRIVDYAEVSFNFNNTNDIIGTDSGFTQIEDELYNDWKDGSKVGTIGQLYEKKYGYKSNDWHADVSKKSRSFIIYNAVLNLAHILRSRVELDCR